MNGITTTSGTGSEEAWFWIVTEPDPFPWHWPPEHRRMLLDIIEASERLAAQKATALPPNSPSRDEGGETP